MTAVDRGYAPMLGALLGLLAGCTASESAAHRERVSTLDRGVAAQLDDQIITMDEVRELSKARNLPVAQARAHLVFDALLATAAHERGLDRTPALLVQRRAVLARALIDQMKQESKAHAITDEEVAKHTQMHWLDLDRPVARRSTHAVVMPKDPDNEADWKAVDRVAARIADAVRGEKDAEAFKKKAEAVDKEGLEVVIQDLPPVTEDGRVADLTQRLAPGQPPATFDSTFVKILFRLDAVGDQSTPSRSPFGSHVILWVATQEASQLPWERRKEMLTEEILATRMREQLEALLSSLRAQSPVSVERNAETVMLLLPDDFVGTDPRGQ